MSNKNIEDELNNIKKEMKELKELLLSKKKIDGEEIEPPAEPSPPKKPKKPKDPRHGSKHGSKHGFRISIDEDFNFDNFDQDDINQTLNNYLSMVLSGVSKNLQRSMESVSKNFANIKFDTAKDIEREIRQHERNLRRKEREIEKAARKMEKRARKAMKKQFFNKVIHLHEFNEEELEDFYDTCPSIISALADSRRLQLLKILEKGPTYQGELSDQTGIKGGTFKHHMDNLLSSKFVYQEATRGRYLITQLGVEAIKLAEMIYRRYVFEMKKDRGEIEEFEEDIVDIEDTDIEDLVDVEQDININIDKDITNLNDTSVLDDSNDEIIDLENKSHQQTDDQIDQQKQEDN